MSTLKTNTLSNVAGTASTAIENAINGSAKAWVRFDASSGTPTINGSYNVSSITDNGVGSYTVNFTTALQDENYAVTVGVSNATYIEYWNLFDQPSGSYVAPTASAFRSTFYGQSSYRDPKSVMFSVFR